MQSIAGLRIRPELVIPYGQPLRWMRFASLVPSFAAVLFAVIFNGVVAAEPTLHLLLACDSGDPDLGEGFGLVSSRFATTFDKNVAPGQLNLIFLAGSELTAAKLKESIASVPANPDDTLVVYLACHGNFDPSTGSYFTLSDDRSVITRNELTAAVKNRKLKFSAVMTDACNNYARFPLQQKLLESTATPRSPETEITTQPLFRSLFFRQSGFLDLSSSGEGEYAVYFNNYRELLPYKAKGQEPPPALVQKIQSNLKGGIFSEALADLLQKERGKALNWGDIVPQVAAQTLQDYRKEVPDGKMMVQGFPKRQPEQTVTAIELPIPLDAPEISGTNTAGNKSNSGTNATGVMNAKNRLGIRCHLKDGKLVVAQVDPGSVADDYRIAVGDIIEAVNGAMAENLDSIAELDAQLKAASLFIRVVVVRTDGKKQSFTAMLPE